jgi:pimeloyl-ACP methyl ester carboxylesterase
LRYDAKGKSDVLSYWVLILVLGFLVALPLITAYIFSNTVLYSRRQPIVRTPREYGMAYEDIQFKSSDGLVLKGWFIPVAGASDKAIIMTHPLPFNRHGFIAKNQGFPPLCNIDVDLLKMAHALHQASYPVLMFDFRNHGESASGLTGVGLNEYQDVLGAIAYLGQRPDLVNPKLGFVSFCMGANSTIIALSKGAEQVQAIKFLVAVQPVSAAVFVRQYLRAEYTPMSVFLAAIVDWFVQRRGGYALKAMSPLPYVKDIKVPTLYIQARADRWTTVADTQSFYDATLSEKELWWIEGITRRFDAYNYVGDHPERILEFVKTHF